MLSPELLRALWQSESARSRELWKKLAALGVPGLLVPEDQGGLGLCEYVQHVSLLDYVVVSGSLDGRFTEYAAHLHEHFVDPVRVHGGRYLVPDAPGYSAEMRPESRAALAFPDGSEWRGA